MSDLDKPLACQLRPDWWYSKARKKVEHAKVACSFCPLQAACADYAIRNSEFYGIWGGLDEDERRELRRQMKRHQEGAAA